MKKLLSVLLTIALLLSTGATIALAEEAAQNPVTIRISWWGDTARHEKYNAICDAFQEKYPWITVERETNTWSDYWDKLATLVAGGNAPDVMGMHPQFVSDYASRGALADLQPFVDSGVIDVSKINPSVLEGGTVNGKLSMIAMGLTVQTILVNKDLCDEVGVTVPAMGDSWTWQQFADLCVEFRQKSLEKGMDIYFSNEATGYTTFQYLARSNGGDLYTTDGSLGFTQADLVQWLTYWKNLRDQDAIPDAATTSESLSLTMEQSPFVTGLAATAFIPVNQYWQYVKQLPDTNIVCEFMPTTDDGASGAFLEGAHWAMSANLDEAHQQAAALLLNFLSNDEGAWQYMLMDQGVPANSDMAAYIEPLLSDANKVAIQFVQLVMPTITRAYVYAPKGATSMSTLFTDARESSAFETATPEEAAATFFTNASAVLTENK